MISLKKSSAISSAAMTMSVVFIVLCFFSIDNSRLSILRSKQSLQLSQLGSTSIAPDNLPLAADIFRTSIPVQDHDFPIDSLTRLPAWTTLQSTLSAYKDRLKLLDTQNRELDHRLQQRSMQTSFAALGAILISLLLRVFVRLGGRRQAA